MILFYESLDVFIIIKDCDIVMEDSGLKDIDFDDFLLDIFFLLVLINDL